MTFFSLHKSRFFSSLALGDEALVVGKSVAPAGLKFVLERPHGLSLNVGVEGLVDALADLTDLSLREAGAVDRALAVHSDIWVSTERSLHVGITVKVNGKVSLEVRLGAVYPLATTR